MIDLTRAKSIPGFMGDAELAWLAEQAQVHNLIVEIGSYLGRSTRALGDHTEGTVIAIDDWKGPRDRECDLEQLYKRFYRNMLDLINAGKVRYHRADHAETESLAAYCENKNLAPDMVFIDGCHEYESVKRDILFWKSRLAPGGLLCGHDAAAFPGVRRAIKELLPAAVIAPQTDIWLESPD